MNIITPVNTKSMIDTYVNNAVLIKQMTADQEALKDSLSNILSEGLHVGNTGVIEVKLQDRSTTSWKSVAVECNAPASIIAKHTKTSGLIIITPKEIA